ncbi:MAG TPA: DUF5908 family protein [Kofleriaceae bacterium]
MSIEIKELVIRAVVDARPERSAAAAPTASTGEQQDAIVEAAVREVLRVLRAAKER